MEVLSKIVTEYFSSLIDNLILRGKLGLTDERNDSLKLNRALEERL